RRGRGSGGAEAPSYGTAAGPVDRTCRRARPRGGPLRGPPGPGTLGRVIPRNVAGPLREAARREDQSRQEGPEGRQAAGRDLAVAGQRGRRPVPGPDGPPLADGGPGAH